MPPTIVDSLQQKATSSPNSIAYSFLDESNNIAEQITYGQLLAESESWAATLRGKYQRGDRVLISFPPGLDFIKALYAYWRLARGREYVHAHKVICAGASNNRSLLWELT